MLFPLGFMVLLTGGIICRSIRQKRMARQRGFSNSMKMFGYGTRVEELLNPETYHKYIRPGVDSGKNRNHIHAKSQA